MEEKKGYGIFYRWFLPAIVFQSIYMGGGFTTGREVMEFGGRFGVNGIYSVIFITLGFFVAAFLSYELARIYKTFDYRTWVKMLLWKFWPIFDVAFIILAIIVIAVVGSAAANIMQDMLHLPYMLSAIVVIGAIGVLHFYGRFAIEWFEVVGTIILYAMYAILWGITLKYAWGDIGMAFERGLSAETPWDASIAGIKYFAYNMPALPAVLFTIDRLERRSDSLMAGLSSSLLVSVAFFLTWLCLLGFYTKPEVVNAPVPWYEIMKAIGGLWIRGFYVFAVFWTLIETGTGMIHAIIRRVEVQLKELKGVGLTKAQEGIIATVIAIISILFARYGIIALVARGYGILAWVFFATYFIPLITIGIIRIVNPNWKREFWSKA